MHWDWRWLVVPGSALCVLPLVLILGVLVMPQTGARHTVWRWWWAVAVGVGLTAGSKIAFYGWGVGVPAWDLTCFSGHTVLALSLWPVALSLVVPPARPMLRAAAGLTGWVFALLIGFSRIELRAHPLSEVIAGALLGGLVAAVGLHALRRQWLRPRASGGVALLLCGALVVTWVAERRFPMLPTENWLARIALVLSGHQAPVDREQWRRR
ncbi:MAG TPA: phosphatase PAP2 family protein [Stenotrophomonas sp.]|jgi:membrane-associated phospholipid phosphatase